MSSECSAAGRCSATCHRRSALQQVVARWSQVTSAFTVGCIKLSSDWCRQSGRRRES
ncbi:unnamed protein product [Cuscuta europaea]|uniref:Uncharacterized protein n=1 Tax=Cuscuta europaea TaxID=41803 RepID=A0A9P0Z669_CUSEU|nr:unnamed protein product [Cuscuta europaea]